MNLLRQRGIPSSFETTSLCVRRYQLTDDHDLYEAARASIREVYPFLPWCHPGYSLSESRAWLKTIRPDWDQGASFSMVIRDKQTDELMGGCGLNRIDEHPTMNLGYWIKTTASGRGVATEACRGLIQFGFQHLGLLRIEILMSVVNHGSRRVAEKSGARFEGLLSNRLFLHGVAHDARLYALTPSDLLA